MFKVNKVILAFPHFSLGGGGIKDFVATVLKRNEGGGDVKKFKNWVTSFMDDP
jgi:hypothetical protein